MRCFKMLQRPLRIRSDARRCNSPDKCLPEVDIRKHSRLRASYKFRARFLARFLIRPPGRIRQARP